MPRPLRIEYENAYYHVMNRGRGRQNIFHNEEYYDVFLLSLSEAHQRFGLQVLCYCLMSNHYHLLALFLWMSMITSGMFLFIETNKF